MKQDHTSLLPFLLAFVGLAACIAFGVTDPKRTGGPAPHVAAQAAKVPKPPPVLPEKADDPAPQTAVVAPRKASARNRVVLITVDGWHVRLTDRMPVWKEMAAEGSWTLDAEVPKGATTVISHAALYTGADPKVNGVARELDAKRDGDPHVHGWKFRWRTNPLKVAETLFTATEAAGYKAAAVVQKGKLVQLLRPNDDETRIQQAGDKGLIKAACKAVLDDDIRLLVLHIASPDGTGHKLGWLTEAQYRTAETVSDQLQLIRKCIADAEAAGGVPTTLIVTSDHGGTPKDVCQARKGKDNCGHGANDADNRRVPWVAVGPGIKPGHQIQAPVRLVDTAPTILRILGIPASSISTLSGAEISEIF